MELAIVAASAAGVTILTLVLSFVQSSRLSDAKDEREAARVLVASLTAELATSKSNFVIEKNRADSEKARADALDDLIAKTAAGPVDGAYERLLQKWRDSRISPTTDDGKRVVPPSPTTTQARSSDLLRPGED